MTVTLKGSSPAALTAGILLLSRARSFGLRIQVEILGAQEEISPVLGPAILHSPVLASCGVGRELGSGALVIVPGPASEPLAACLAADGDGPWISVDRAGLGGHPASRAVVRLSRDPRPQVRELVRRLRRLLSALGGTAEPAILDLLFGAPAPPLVRLAIALRAGRAMTGRAGVPITRFLLRHGEDLPDPLPAPVDMAQVLAAREDGRLQGMLDRFSVELRDQLEGWIEEWLALPPGEGQDELTVGLAELLSHLASLPPHAMLPPLDPAIDALAVGLGPSLGAVSGEQDPNRALVEVFRFLGGRFTPEARFPVELPSSAPPEDRLLRWRWFCAEIRQAADTADALWRRVMDPPQ